MNLDIGDVVVTGGAGAIGSRLVARLLERGANRIVIVDDLSSGYEWLVPRDPRVELRVSDVVDLPTLEIELDRPIVFHLAAFFANQNSVDHPLSDLHTNGKGTLTALMWAADAKARSFVYASAGCSIAGHGIDAPIREDMPVSLDLDTPYQITKALGEFYCNYFHRCVPTVRCRFFNCYGPGEVPGEYRNVIPNFIWRALHDEPLVITGTGDETRDFIYVADMADALIECATNWRAYGEAINLGTGIQTRIRDLAEAVIAATNSSSTIEFAPRRSWDNSLRREANIDKARELIGFAPRVRLEEGLRDTVRWFYANRDRIDASLRAGR